MPGYIDNTSEDALFDSYAQGRALGGAKVGGQYAQWSAVNDDRTCDWCEWADLRIFDAAVEPWDPPVHWGCKCILVWIRKDEFTPTPDWGSGPPDGAWPPGRSGGTGPDGKPVLSSEGKLPKPGKFDESLVEDIVDSWDMRFGEIVDWNSSRPWTALEDPTFLDMWLTESSELLLGEGFDKAVFDEVKDVIERWVDFATAEQKALFSNLSQGSVDTLQAAIKDVLGVWPDAGLPLLTQAANDAGMAEAFMLHWEARTKIASEVFKASPLVQDGQLTVYRGIRSMNKGDFADKIFKQLSSGDLEFSIGTDFAESWASDGGVAEFFSSAARAEVLEEDFLSGMVFKKKINVDDIMVSWLDNSEMSWTEMNEVLWSNFDGTLVPKNILKKTQDFMEIEIW